MTVFVHHHFTVWEEGRGVGKEKGWVEGGGEVSQIQNVVLVGK